MKRVMRRLVQLRAEDPQGHLVFHRDLKRAFRQILVDPGGAQVFAYVWDELLIVELRLQFGWRGSLGWSGLVAEGIEHAQCIAAMETVVR